ncbi:hypothetical protein IEQ34_013221 [Dendrobium chrysotoxum]|uniref:Secreted protein n=1 Tax=Dendrobium chrysotoxum TaxID=161865 RepID=A0AAV7GMU9_DENCH|nr:hypothetical protein IEQ34_013221 [Dendrobium chrysotoxum]
MVTSTLLNLLLTLAISAPCHAKILAFTSSFFTRCTETSSATDEDEENGRRGEGKGGFVSGTMARGFVSSSTSSPILPKLLLPSAAVVSIWRLEPATTMALNSRLIEVKFSTSLPTEREVERWLATSQGSLVRPRDGGACGGFSAWISRISVNSSAAPAAAADDEMALGSSDMLE